MGALRALLQRPVWTAQVAARPPGARRGKRSSLPVTRTQAEPLLPGGKASLCLSDCRSLRTAGFSAAVSLSPASRP